MFLLKDQLSFEGNGRPWKTVVDGWVSEINVTDYGEKKPGRG